MGRVRALRLCNPPANVDSVSKSSWESVAINFHLKKCRGHPWIEPYPQPLFGLSVALHLIPDQPDGSFAAS